MPKRAMTIPAIAPSAARPPVQTLREQNRADKRERIKLAARTLFSEHGFDKTTLRQIAARAGVGLGTIMLYADDKRDLVLLMYNDEVTALIVHGTKRISPQNDVISNIVDFCDVFYQGFSSSLSLARTYLQLNFYSEGANTLGLHQNRQRKLDAIRMIIENGRRRGEIRLDADVDTMATAVLLLYRSAVRIWIAEPRPDPDQGLAKLRQLMEVVYQGMSAHAAPPGPASTRRLRSPETKVYAST